jgi:outer membrane protein TolC
LRNENVGVTRKNYDIARAKEQVGYSGTSDVFRWESELALDNIDLNSAQAQLRQAQFNLNNLLNRPISEEFKLADIALSDSIILIFDERLTQYINNPGIIELFADFMVEEAFRNLPEIKQLDAAVNVQERSLKSQNRAFALPSLALSGQYDYPIGNYYYPEGVNAIPLQPTYNAAVALQVPIFQGRSRIHQQQQTKIGLLQLQDQMQDLRNKLEFQVRANLETAGASFSNMALSRQSAEAAQKNFEIIQNSYRQGLVNVTSLIDAQNAALSAKINATNAAYTFISDFLAVERAVGYFHFLALEESQEAFLQRFIQFIENK